MQADIDFRCTHNVHEVIKTVFLNKNMDSSSEKSKSEGNKHCCYGTCNNDSRYRHRENMEGVFFIPFPKPLTRRQTCEKWIKACGRPDDDFNCNKIKRSTYICSKHFVGGKGPTKKNPDPIPVLLHTDEQVSVNK